MYLLIILAASYRCRPQNVDGPGRAAAPPSPILAVYQM